MPFKRIYVYKLPINWISLKSQRLEFIKGSESIVTIEKSGVLVDQYNLFLLHIHSKQFCTEQNTRISKHKHTFIHTYIYRQDREMTRLYHVNSFAPFPRLPPRSPIGSTPKSWGSRGSPWWSARAQRRPPTSLIFCISRSFINFFCLLL